MRSSKTRALILDRGLLRLAQVHTDDVVGAHQPFHAFVVDRLICVLVEFDGHSPDSDGAIEFLVVLAYTLHEGLVGVLAVLPGVASGPPFVVARPVQAEYLSQPLHPVGGVVVVNELKAALPVRLSREIFGRLAQNVTLGR